MQQDPMHPSDEEILLVIDGEATPKRTRQVHKHLEACWACRARTQELEHTIAQFASLHGRTLDFSLHSGEGPRALLKARLAEEDAPTTSPFSSFFHSFSRLSLTAGVSALIAIAFVAATAWWLHLSRSRPSLPEAFMASAAIPDHNLTPGATRPVTISDVCSAPHEEVVREVPSSLREQVFKEYGIRNASPEDYEIDYLIAPRLGGTEDIRNLWPEPEKTAGWNAHVKDQLEERLHQLVCSGQVDLPTAQRAIATDWIKAYKKYLDGDQYLSELGKYPRGVAEIL